MNNVIVSLKVIINDKALQINFLNIFHSFDLEYNLFSVGPIKKNWLLSLDQNSENESVVNRDDVALMKTQIYIRYLISSLSD